LQDVQKRNQASHIIIAHCNHQMDLRFIIHHIHRHFFDFSRGPNSGMTFITSAGALTAGGVI